MVEYRRSAGGGKEYWELKADDGQILISDPYYRLKNRSHSAKPIIPTLQYSIIPIGRITAKSIISDLAQRTRFSTVE